MDQIKAIFTAVSKLDAVDRAAVLDAACRDDADLRREVESLLHEHDAGMGHASTQSYRDSAMVLGSTASTPLTEKPGTRIGPYKLLQQIGEGGFGAVFMAEQEQPVRRRVALKIIKLGMDTRQVVARFEQERQALAMMDHPNIARVLDAGATETGRPYFVMELVKGIPITDYCDSNQLTAAERLNLFVPICNAVQHAHQKGIIHRDIKPTNILVTLHDGRPVPKVIDFGIAKATDARLTEKTLFTEHRAMIGTPAYMSPEQAEMSGLDIDTRSDVYSLGVLLYELLTGTTPFSVKDLMDAGYGEIQRIIREVDPPKPSTRVSTLGDSLGTIAARRKVEPRRFGLLLRGDLDWIVMRCIEKDRTRRYDAASSLAMDVQRHLSGEPVLAAPPSAAYRMRKYVKKHRAGSMVAAALILAVMGTSTGMIWALRERAEQSRARKEAEDQRERAEANEARALAEAARNDELGRRARAGLAKVLLLASHDFPSAELPGLTPEMLSGNDTVTVDVKGKTGPGDVRFNPDGTVAILNSQALDSTASIEELIGAAKNAATSLVEQRRLAEFEAYIARLGAAVTEMSADAWQRARDHLAACTDSLRGWEWSYLDRESQNPVFTLRGHSSWVKSASFSPDGTRIVTASDDGTARMWDAARSDPIGQPLKHDSDVNFAVFSPDGTRVLTASGHAAYLWDATKGESTGVLLRHGGDVYSAAFSPNGTRVLTAGKGIQVWDATTGEPLSDLMQLDHQTRTAVFSPDGTQVVTTFNTTALVLDAATLLPVGKPIEYRNAVVNSAVFSPDGAVILTATGDDYGYATAQIWDAVTFEPAREPIRYILSMKSAAFSPDGTRIVTAFDGGTAQVWDAASGQPLGPRMRHEGNPMVDRIAVNTAAFSPDGTRVLTASDDGTARVWDIAKPTAAHHSLYGKYVSMAKFLNKDGSRLITREGELVKFWDTDSGRELATIHGAKDDPVFSPDGSRFAVRMDDGCAQIYSSTTGAGVSVLQGLHDRGVSLAFNRDGTRVLSKKRTGDSEWHGDTEYDARLWDATTGALLAELKGIYDARRGLRFSPAGKWIAGVLSPASNESGPIRLWDSATGTMISEIQHDDFMYYQYEFSPDDTRMVVAVSDRRAEILEPATGQRVAELELDTFEPVPRGGWRFSPDAQLLLGLPYINSADSTVWETSGGKRVLGPDDSRYEFSPDGSRIVIHSTREGVVLFDAEAGTRVATLKKPDEKGWPCEYSPDGTYIMIGDEGSFSLRRSSTGEVVGEMSIGVAGIDTASFSPDSASVLLKSIGRGELYLCDIPSCESRATIPSGERCASFSPGGRFIVAGEGSYHRGGQDEVNEVRRVWYSSTGEELTWPGRLHNSTIEFTADDSRLIESSADAWRIINTATRQEIATVWRRYHANVKAAIRADGQRVAITSGANPVVPIYDADNGSEVGSIKGHEAAVTAAAFSQDGGRIATASRDNTARIWDAQTAKQVFTLEGHTDEVLAVDFNRDGSRLVTASADRTARIWDATTGQSIAELSGHAAPVDFVAYNVDGSRIATRSTDGAARLWDAATGTQIAILGDRAGSTVNKVAFSPDGGMLVTCGDSHAGQLWDAEAGAPLRRLEGHTAAVLAACFSPDSSRVLTGSADRTARVWDVATGELIHELDNHGAAVTAVAFSPDGSRIATGTEDAVVRIWDTQRFRQVLPFRDLGGKVTDLYFTADGRRLVAVAGETVHIWDGGEAASKINAADATADGSRN